MPEDSLGERNGKITDTPLEEPQSITYSTSINGNPADVSLGGAETYSASSRGKIGNIYRPEEEEGNIKSPQIDLEGDENTASPHRPADSEIEHYIGSDEEIPGDQVPQGSEKYPGDALPAEPEGIYHALLLIKYDKEKDNLVVGGFFPAEMKYRDMNGIASVVYGDVSKFLGVEKDTVWALVKPLEIGGQNYTFYALTDTTEDLEGAKEVPLLGEGEMPKLPSE